MGDVEGVVGDWKTFTFKMIKPSDQTEILDHLCEFLFYPALHVFGYEKSLESDWRNLFKGMITEEDCLSFCAVDKATGKVAGVRVMSVVKRGEPPEEVWTDEKNKDMAKCLFNLYEECKVFEKYDVPKFAEFFGTSVDPTFRQQGLCEEMYRRSMILLKAKGFKVGRCSFTSLYSRKAGKKNGFIELNKCYINKLRGGVSGELLNPEADPALFIDLGVFEI